MKNLVLFLSAIFLCLIEVRASEISFIVKENGVVLKQEGNCSNKHTTGCDFSFVLSLIGFDSGILKDENTPQWPYKEGYETFLNAWKTPHTPRTWIVDSCVWYSGNIVEDIGFDKIQEYIHKFEYGNQDISGINRHDWPGALLISPEEQVDFIQKFLNKALPVSEHAYEMTKNILFIQDLIGGWKLYGKTGVGEGEGDKRIGWFIGWISKGERRIPFSSCAAFLQKQKTIPSFIAKNKAMEELFWLINTLEK